MSMEPQRETVWNTYMPWYLALTGTLSIIIGFIVMASWIPTPAIEGVPPEAYSAPVFPGALSILFMVMAGRQLFLRSQAK